MFDIFKLFNLQTFGEGGGDGGAAGGEGAGGNAAPGSGQESTAKTGKGGRTAAAAEDLSKVQYGKQEEAEQQPEAAEEKPAEPEKAAKPKMTFDELLKSDESYQREMQKRIDNAINRRFAKSKAAEEQQNKLAPALNLLATKYGVAAGDTEALIEAINGDSDLIEQQAMDAGMEPDAYREYQRIKAENEAFKRAAEERERQDRLNNAYTEWRRQEAEAQQIFPGLSLDTEIQNQTFSELLSAGLDVLTAYKTVHLDEISKGLIRNAAADAQRETIAKIQQKQNRPREGAAGKTQAATVRADPRNLTARDFDEIMRRAARGEKIRF
jgi:hypothetical protein